MALTGTHTHTHPQRNTQRNNFVHLAAVSSKMQRCIMECGGGGGGGVPGG